MSDQDEEIAKEKDKEKKRVRYKEDEEFKLKKMKEFEKNKDKIIENQRKRREEWKNKPQYKVDQQLINDMNEIDDAERVKHTDPQAYEQWWAEVN